MSGFATGFARVGLAALGLALLAWPGRSEEAGRTGVILEAAPGELGALRVDGMTVMTAAPGGKELLFLEAESGRLTTFLESGARWGDPVQLLDEQGAPFELRTPGTMAAGDGLLAVGATFESHLFRLRDGSVESHLSDLLFASDFEHTPMGWALGLTNMPYPAGGIYGRKRFDADRVPRVVLLDDDFEVWREGLVDEEPAESGSLAAARELSLAWDGHRLFAAELANYRIYAMNRRLELRATYLDSSLILEEGVGAVDEAAAGAIVMKLETAAERQGKSLVPSRESEQERQAPSAEAFTYQPVIQDIAWDAREHRLLLLVSAGVVGPHAALDILDPDTGEGRRVFLRLPSGAEPQRFGQLVAGHDYIWLRNYNGQRPTYRLDRISLIDRGQEIAVPEVSRFEEGELEVDRLAPPGRLGQGVADPLHP